MTTIKIKNVYRDQVPAANTTIYTCPENTSSKIMNCTVTNDTSTAKTITFHIIEEGEAVADNRLILPEMAVGTTPYKCPEMVGQVLNAGDYINAIAEAANQLVVSLSVVEIV